MKLFHWRALAACFLLASPLFLSVAPAIAQADPTSDATSARVNAALAQLDTLAQQNLAKTGVPGMAVAVVYQDQVVYLKGFGVRETGKAAAIDADTVFQLASVSKPIGSTIVAALVGDGVLDWDDPIIKCDPAFQMSEPWITSQVTFRDMLSHRSGLPDGSGDLLEDMGYSREEILHRLRYEKPASSFRSQYAYTNFGYSEGGVAAAMAAGKRWEDLAAERLYQPLGMTSTSSRYSAVAAAQNRALPHVQVDGKWVARYDRNADSEAPAGGVSSTVRDLAQWVRLQLGNGMVDGHQIVASKALAETHRPEIVSNPAANPSADRAGFYGLGWNVNYDDPGPVRLSHSGAFNLGVGTAVYLLPDQKLGIVALTNGAPIGLPEALAASFLDLATTGKVQKDWFTLYAQAFSALEASTFGSTANYAQLPASPSPSLPLDAYAGTYANDYFGQIEIAVRDGGLVMLIGPNQDASFALRMPLSQSNGAAIPLAPRQLVYPLQHYDHDTFTYQPDGESGFGTGLSGVTFQIGPEQHATSYTDTHLNGNGEGTLTRVLPPH